MNELITKLESLLFVSNKPLTAKALAKYSDADESSVTAALQELHALRKDTGIVLLIAGDEYQLATNSANSDAVKTFLNSDLRESLTEATVEVLAIIAYRQPISKAEIESIRGVNSQYSLRALLMRGLIDKIPNPNDARGMLYQVTTEFMQHLGITSVNDLPEFEKLIENIKLPDLPNMTDPENTGQE
jgi:segregation and condensation protein B